MSPTDKAPITESQYVAFTRSTANSNTLYSDTYLYLGLASEVGEVADVYKKSIARGKGVTGVNKEEVAQELADVLWYLTRLTDTLGYSLGDLRLMNYEKLSARQEAGTLVERSNRDQPADPRSYGP